MDKEYTVVNINEFIINQNDNLGAIINTFDCSRQNEKVHHFLKANAIEFAKKGQAVTYFVFDVSQTVEMVGYFAVTIKPITVLKSRVGRKCIRKIERVCRLNDEEQNYHFSAYLLAQLGKNYSDGVRDKISGGDLLEIAEKEIAKIKFSIGGVALFLEAENVGVLQRFYESHGYTRFSTRISYIEEDRNPTEYLQYIKTI